MTSLTTGKRRVQSPRHVHERTSGRLLRAVPKSEENTTNIPTSSPSRSLSLGQSTVSLLDILSLPPPPHTHAHPPLRQAPAPSAAVNSLVPAQIDAITSFSPPPPPPLFPPVRTFRVWKAIRRQFTCLPPFFYIPIFFGCRLFRRLRSEGKTKENVPSTSLRISNSANSIPPPPPPRIFPPISSPPITLSSTAHKPTTPIRLPPHFYPHICSRVWPPPPPTHLVLPFPTFSLF